MDSENMSNQKQPRFYQRNAHRDCFKAWAEYRTILGHSATGSGKTFIAASIIDTVLKNGKRALFVGDSDELCLQPLKAIGDFCDVFPALEKADHKASLEARVVVGSLQTLNKRKRLERFPEDHFDYVICDELHRSSAGKKKIFDYFGEAFCLGLTATPWRQGLRDLSKFCETVAFSVPMMDLIGMGFAPKIRVLTLPIEVDLNAVRQSMGADGKDFNLEDIDTCIAPYFQAVADLIGEHAWDRKIIASLPLIKSSEAFAQIMRNNGLAFRHVDGNTPDRTLIYRQLERGEIQGISNAMVLSTGVDIPAADCFLNLCVTRSSSLYQQRMGRTGRPLQGVVDDLPEANQAEERKARIAASRKPDTLILDLLWQHETLGVVRPGDMFTNTPEEAKRLFDKVKDSRTPQELLALALEVQREKELTLVEKLNEAADKHRGRDLRAEHIGIYLEDKSLIEYEPVAAWEMKKPSAAQLELLQRMGVEMASVQSKGMASKIISILVGRRERGLATLKQTKLLRSFGVENSHLVSFGKASSLIDDLMRQIKATKQNELFAKTA